MMPSALVRISVALLLLVSANAFASTKVKLDMTLTLNGKSTKPTIIVLYGQAGTISEKDSSGNGVEITVIPTEASIPNKAGKAVKLDFVISELKDNEKTVVGNSEITTLLGQSAIFSQKKPGGRSLRLVVLPQDFN